MFAPAGRITARAGLRSKLAAIVLAAKRSPLRTPIMWSSGPKAKNCRSAAIFLTLFRPLPFDPSGAKCNLRLPAAQRPPCVKGAVTEGDWGIVTLPIHRLTLARSQSLRPCGAPAYALGPSVAARHLPTLWGVTLYTREASRGDASITPYTQPKRLPLKRSRTLVGTSIARPRGLALP